MISTTTTWGDGVKRGEKVKKKRKKRERKEGRRGEGMNTPPLFVFGSRFRL